MPKLLAIDQGTTSCRAIVFDSGGSVVSSAQREFGQSFPKPCWVEQDAEEIWSTQSAVIDEAVRDADLQRGELVGVGITNQRETVVVWDRRTGRPIAPAIVWQDRRTAEDCDRLRVEGHEPMFRERTGLLLDPYFSGTKLAWLLDHTPGARDAAERGELAFGTIDSWLIWKLTGGSTHITDASNASRTLLLDIHTGAWSDELCEVLRVPRSLLPAVVPSIGIVAEVSSLDVIKGVPIAGIVGDQQAATLGQTCTTPGLAKNTYGTGCFLLMNTGGQPQASQHQLLTTIAWQHEQQRTYALEGAVFVGGAVVQWLRDGLGIIKRSNDIEALAASVPDTGGVTLVPALTGLGAPHWQPNAQGTLTGISRGTTAAHLARAALEGIAFQVADLVRAMEADAGKPLTELRVDGGAAANNLLMQIQADLLQRPVVRPTQLETTALGAAYAAGLAVGVYRSTDELTQHWAIDRTFEPVITADEAASKLAAWSRAVRTTIDHATRLPDG